MFDDENFEDLKVDDIHATGCEYARMNRREEAIRWLGTSAAKGYIESQLELGHLFAKSGDYKCALEWYSRPRNEPAAFFYIAKIMFEQDRYWEAKNNYEKAANLRHTDAQFQLGLYYYNLWGLTSNKISNSRYLPDNYYVDKGSARQWFYSSAEGGNSLAAYYMGRIFEYGEGIDIDKYKALAWYNESKAGGYLPANECVERLHKQGYVHVPEDKVIPYRKGSTKSEKFIFGTMGLLLVAWFFKK